MITWLHLEESIILYVRLSDNRAAQTPFYDWKIEQMEQFSSNLPFTGAVVIPTAGLINPSPV